jgi:hypothetical protein
VRGNTRYITFVVMIQTPLCFDDSRQEVLTPTAHVNAGRPRNLRTPANEDAKISVVKREPWKSAGHIHENLEYPKYIMTAYYICATTNGAQFSFHMILPTDTFLGMAAT